MTIASTAPLTRVLQQVLDRTSDHRVVVIVAHGLVELSINTLVDAYCKNHKKITNDHRSYTHGTKLVLLHEMGVLPDAFYEILDRLRRLRNKAAHDAVFVVDTVALKHLAEPFAKHLPADLESAASPTESLNAICAWIVNSVWSQYQAVLMPVFMPGLAEELASIEKGDS